MRSMVEGHRWLLWLLRGRLQSRLPRRHHSLESRARRSASLWLGPHPVPGRMALIPTGTGE